MDFVSHGLWGGIATGRKNKKIFWWSFLIGMLPDLLSFGIYTMLHTINALAGGEWISGQPTALSIPPYVYTLYSITHSLLIFVVIFMCVWILCRKPWLPLLAWGLHILVDIPTHSLAFFPTPFLWPISDYVVDGISWGTPVIFYPNCILLCVAYIALLYQKKRVKPQ